MEAMDDMGMTFSTESAAEDLENLQHMFRNATPASEARAKNEEREKAKKEKAERAAAEKAKKEAKGGKKEESRRVTAWPTDLMFYLRASELLQGLCSLLETRHPFMHTMAHAARLACGDRVPAWHRLSPAWPVLTLRAPAAAAALLQAPTLLDGAAVRAAVEAAEEAGGTVRVPGEAPSAAGASVSARLTARLQARLRTLHRGGAFVGCQVAVLQSAPTAPAASDLSAAYGRPTVLACVSAGAHGVLDPRPVHPASLFPVLGASRVGVAAAAAYLVDTAAAAAAASGRPPAVSLATRVEAAWPAFAAAGKGGCTVGELLRCRSGVEGVLPAVMTTSSLTRGKWAEGAAAVAAAAPLVLPRLLPDGTEVGAAADSDSDGEDEPAAAAGTGAGAEVPTAAFQTLPAPLAACFHQTASGARLQPNVGPGPAAELTSHLWFGWGWAAGQALAGMAAASAVHGIGLGAATPPPTAAATGGGSGLASAAAPAPAAASALSVLLRDGVQAAMGLRAHAAFGVVPDPQQPSPPPATAAGAGGAAAAEAPLTPHPADALGPAAAATVSSMATLSLGPSGALDGVPSEQEEAAAAAGGATAAAALTSPRAGDAGAGAGAVAGPSPADDGGDAEANEVTVASAMAAMELAETMAGGGLSDLTGLASGGREHLMDPRLVNIVKIRAALVPSLNLYASALGLATMADYTLAVHVRGMGRAMAAGAGADPVAAAAWRAASASSSSSSGAPSPPHGMASVPRSTAFTFLPPPSAAPPRRGGRPPSPLLWDLRAVWGAHCAGMRLFGFRVPDVAAPAPAAAGSSPPPRHAYTLASGLGCMSLGGSAVLTDASTGVTIAVTVNRLTSDRALTRHLLDIVCEELALGQLVDL